MPRPKRTGLLDKRSRRQLPRCRELFLHARPFMLPIKAAEPSPSTAFGRSTPRRRPFSFPIQNLAGMSPTSASVLVFLFSLAGVNAGHLAGLRLRHCGSFAAFRTAEVRQSGPLPAKGARSVSARRSFSQTFERRLGLLRQPARRRSASQCL